MKKESTIQGIVEILAHEGRFIEQLSLVCQRCGATTLNALPYYKNAKIRYEDGTENFFRKFFVINKEIVCNKERR